MLGVVIKARKPTGEVAVVDMGERERNSSCRVYCSLVRGRRFEAGHGRGAGE